MSMFVVVGALVGQVVWLSWLHLKARRQLAMHAQRIFDLERNFEAQRIQDDDRREIARRDVWRAIRRLEQHTQTGMYAPVGGEE